MTFPNEKIVEAAEKAGFTSELRAAAIISNENWQVEQNVYFMDKDERKGRELDIRAYKVFRNYKDKPEVSCIISLCIEIKKTADPFIFYSTKKRDVDGAAGFGLFNWRHNIGPSVLSYKAIELKRPFSKVKRLARSYSNFKNGQTQQIQGGVLSAFKAAIHERDNCDERYSDSSRDFCLFIPILVVDGPLYDCFFTDGSNDLTAQEVDELVYLQNYHSEHYGRVHNNVVVMRLSALPNRIKDFTAWGKNILSTLETNRMSAIDSSKV